MHWTVLRPVVPLLVTEHVQPVPVAPEAVIPRAMTCVYVGSRLSVPLVERSDGVAV